MTTTPSDLFGALIKAVADLYWRRCRWSAKGLTSRHRGSSARTAFLIADGVFAVE